MVAIERIEQIGEATDWNPSADDTVFALFVSGSAVYAAGCFTLIGAQPEFYLAAVDAVTGSALPWYPDSDGVVRTVAVSGDLVYAGGSFTYIGGQPRSRLAALDKVTAVAAPWAPSANGDVNGKRVSCPVLVIGNGADNACPPSHTCTPGRRRSWRQPGYGKLRRSQSGHPAGTAFTSKDHSFPQGRGRPEAGFRRRGSIRRPPNFARAPIRCCRKML